MRSLWWLAVAVIACGDIEKVPDAAVPDTYAPDSKNELTCSGGETACMGGCANMMTDELNCGACGNQCSPVEGCASGTCVPATTCNRVRAIDAAAPDGTYVNPNNGVAFYCDFTNNRTYDGLFMGQSDGAHTIYSQVTVAQLADPAFQKLFINHYNRNGGLLLIATWTSTNCCFKASGNNMFLAGGAISFPSLNGTTQCNPAGGYVGGPWRLSAAPFATTPLADNVFSTVAVTEAVNCSVGANPAMFWRFKNSLD